MWPYSFSILLTVDIRFILNSKHISKLYFIPRYGVSGGPHPEIFYILERLWCVLMYIRADFKVKKTYIPIHLNIQLRRTIKKLWPKVFRVGLNCRYQTYFKHVIMGWVRGFSPGKIWRYSMLVVRFEVYVSSFYSTIFFLYQNHISSQIWGVRKFLTF